MKILLLDDALRPQAIAVGIPTTLTEALLYYNEEIPVVREQLAGIQTCLSDRSAVKIVVKSGVIDPLLAFLNVGTKCSFTSSRFF